MDIPFLNSVGHWESLRDLIEALGWTYFLSFTFRVYERLCWEFLSSLVVDWNARYQGRLFTLNFDSSIGILRQTYMSFTGV